MEKCPFCAGSIPGEAVVCVHCQRALTEATAGLPEAAVESVSAPHASADAPSRTRRLVGVGLVLAGIVAGFLGSWVLTFLLGWIGFAMMLNASLMVRIGIGLILGQFLMMPFLP